MSSKEYNRKYREKHKEKIREQRAQPGAQMRARKNSLKFNYGISLEQWEQLAKKQDYRCAICKELKPLVVDHDHQTNKVRGLLCHGCNVRLPLIEKYLVEAVLYLQL